MRTPASRLTSRRSFLRSALAVTGIGAVGLTGLAGCDLFTSGGSTEPPTPELEGLLTNTVALGHLYTSVIAAVPALAENLTPLRDAHQTHAEAIAAAIGRPVPSPEASPGSPPTDERGALAALAAAEKVAQNEALVACLAGSARVAPLLGSIAAARASHQEVLV